MDSKAQMFLQVFTPYSYPSDLSWNRFTQNQDNEKIHRNI